MNIIKCFHGSPGSKEDFSCLKKKLYNFKFVFNIRKGYPHHEVGNAKVPNYFIGYSWGSVPCLVEAATSKLTPNAIFLISPYLFINKLPSNLLKLILKIPLLGNSLLKLIAPGKIEDFLIKSSFPDQPSARYKNQKDLFCKPDLLKTSLFEKKLFTKEDVNKAMKIINEKSIPIYVIYGMNDQTSFFHEQILPLEKFTNTTIIKLENAGHALLYTQPERIADILSEHLNKFQNTGEAK